MCGGRISARLACDTLESEYLGTSNQSSRLVSAPPKSLPFRSTLIDEPITNHYFANTPTHGFRSAATPTLVGGKTRKLKPFKTSQNVSLWASQSTCKAFPSCSGPPDVPNSPLCTPHPGHTRLSPDGHTHAEGKR